MTMSHPQVPQRIRLYLDEIAERLYSGHAAVMVGAGFSKNALYAGHDSREFPDWRELGDELYKKLHDRTPPSNQRYISVPQLADEVDATIGRRALDQFLRIEIPDLQFNPSPLHEQLLALPWMDVFTTNYDTLLERASSAIATQRYDVVVTQEDLVYSKSPRIIKLHGSFSSNRPFVITDEDYRRYPLDFAPFVNTVKQRMIESTLCLIGFSGGDPNFVNWVGWTQDALGAHGSAKMYLLTAGLSPSETKLLEQRNIVSVDMSAYLDIDVNNHYKAIERFLDYLRRRKTDYENLNWPIRPTARGSIRTSEMDTSRSDIEVIAEAVPTWREQRRSYPGWVVLPKDQRDSLWMHTKRGYSLFPPSEDLPPSLDLDFAFELVWRLDRCLTPAHTQQLRFIETMIGRYLREPDDPVPIQNPGPSESADHELSRSPEEQQEMCHYLLLSLLRGYREEGDAERWERVCETIRPHLPRLSSEHRARFHYERAVMALYELDLRRLRDELTSWPTESSLPFWQAKKGSLLAYIGDNEESERLLKDALQTIRLQTNLKPVTTDYTLVSQEAYVMVLLNYVIQGLRPSGPSDARHGELQDLRDRWQVLQQYRCDPWLELKIFRQALAAPAASSSNARERPTFDIGSVQRSISFGDNPRAVVAYRYLCFREEGGLPLKIATDVTILAGSHILASDPYWAATTFVQTGKYPKVDLIFDREALARFSIPYTDSLIARYLKAVDIIEEAISRSSHRSINEFAMSVGEVVPEILSRLCSRASNEAKDRILDYLIDLHRLHRRTMVQGIRNLTKRLLGSLSVAGRVNAIPRLLEISTPTELSALAVREFVNPFPYLGVDGSWLVEAMPVLPRHHIEALIGDVASTNDVSREWAVNTLRTLYDLDLLEPEQQEAMATALWVQTDEYGLPKGTGLLRFGFLNLPCPPGTHPEVAFKEYVRADRFFDPDSTSTTMHDIPQLCREIVGASQYTDWSTDEVTDIVNRLYEWWEAEKSNLLRGDDNTWFSVASEYRRRFGCLQHALGAVVAPPFLVVDGTSVTDELIHLTTDLESFGMPVLELQSNMLHLFPEWRDKTRCAIKEAMACSDRATVVDALRAVGVLSRRISTDSSVQQKEDLVALLRVTAEVVYWRRETALASTMDTIADVVGRQPWTLVADTEELLLGGLKHLVSESSLSSDERFVSRERDVDTSAKLAVRESAARLAYTLHSRYDLEESQIPPVIEEWNRICSSDDEFVEIVNQWTIP